MIKKNPGGWFSPLPVPCATGRDPIASPPHDDPIPFIVCSPCHYRRMLVPNKMQHVLCTGNLTTRGSGVYEELRNLAPNVHCVAGDMDDAVMATKGDDTAASQQPSVSFPETKVVKIGQFRIGLVHGHQSIPWGNQDALAGYRRKLGADILISGHTHRNEVTPYDGHYHINPVRAACDHVPSFASDGTERR